MTTKTLVDSPTQTGTSAHAHLRGRRWKSAADAYAAITPRDSLTEFEKRFARNLADLAEYRPEIYRILNQALDSAGDKYAVIAARGNRWTIGVQEEAGRYSPICRGQDPVISAVQSITDFKGAWKSGSAMALCGISDGYVLNALAGFSPKLLLGRQQAVFIIEPDVRLALTVLLLHDFSGPAGPIRQERFHWMIGPDWPAQFERELLADLFLPFPETHVCQTQEYPAIESVFQKQLERLLALDKQTGIEAEKIYAQTTADGLAKLFSDSPPRQPRVMLVTSRFTTVLQYSTADAAQGLEQLGWQTRIVIEPTGHHALRKPAIRNAIVEFKPDFVLLIDHLRHEYEGVFPEKLPFACWIQDHLPILCNRAAAAKVGSREFILTAIGTHFIRQYGYAARQIVDLPNLARVPKIPAQWKSDGLDLVYISNWSRTTDDVVQDVLNQTSPTPQLRIIADHAVAQMLGVYDRGQSLATMLDIRLLIERAQVQCDIAIVDPPLMDGLVNLLWDRLNNHLYRRQSLNWIAELAAERDLQFGIFGRGWEDHPRFSKFARGFVKPGDELETLVRKSKINFQLEPFACVTHPRLLGGIFSGGFFLIRDHPFNRQPGELLKFLRQNLPDVIETTDEARAALPADKRAILDEFLCNNPALSEQADAVQFVRNWHRAGILRDDAAPMACLADVAFDGAWSLREKVGAFLADDDLRGRIARSIREDLQSRFSHEAGLKRAIDKIGNLLRTESCA